MADKNWYSLEEAARILGVSPDEVNQLAQRGELRRFQAGKTWQFRAQDVDEVADARGAARDETTTLPSLHDPDSADLGMHTPIDAGDVVFDFGQPTVGSSKIRIGNPPPSSGKLHKAPDSDVRLKIDSGDDLPILDDASFAPPSSGGSKANLKRKTGMESVGRPDSAVKLEPVPGSSSEMPVPPLPIGDDDATGMFPFEDDVILGSPSKPTLPMKTKSALKVPPPPKTQSPQQSRKATMLAPGHHGGDEQLTGELNLSQPSGKQPPASGKVRGRPTQVAGNKQQGLESPFELSQADLEIPGLDSPTMPTTGKHKPPKTSKMAKPAFELSEEDEVDLGAMPTGGLAGAAGASGINLQAPADSGISLEKVDDNVEFELNLDEDVGGPLSKKTGPSAGSSEFELSLDDSGALAALDEPKKKSSKLSGKHAAAGAELDIFETDFEMPALEDESGMVPMPIEEGDTDLESSDFDLALSDEDSVLEVDSGSQVVALGDEEEQVDDSARTMVRRRKSKLDKPAPQQEEEIEDLLNEEDLDQLDATDEVEDEDDEEEGAAHAGHAVEMAPASWGYLPVAVMIPCVLVMFFVGLMSFELLHSMWGFKQNHPPGGMVVQFLSSTFGGESGPKK